MMDGFYEIGLGNAEERKSMFLCRFDIICFRDAVWQTLLRMKRMRNKPWIAISFGRTLVILH